MTNVNRKVRVSTDSGCDMPESFYQQLDLPRVNLSYIIGDDISEDNGDEAAIDRFYDALIGGAVSTTSGINTQQAEDFLLQQLASGLPVIHLAFSSALSVTYASTKAAEEAIKSKDPEADLTVIDSRCVCGGQAVLLQAVMEKCDLGWDKEQILAWLDENIPRVNHYYSVNELSYLKRSGRVSANAAFWGDILNIKPFMTVDINGKMVPYKKERGRKKILKTFVDEMADRIEDPEDQIVLLCHGQCREDAEIVREMILERIKVKELRIRRIGPVIGSHTGPTVLALFFLGKSRT